MRTRRRPKTRVAVLAGSTVAWQATALDGKRHLVQAHTDNRTPKRTTVCGRHALHLAADDTTTRAWCPTCRRYKG